LLLPYASSSFDCMFNRSLDLPIRWWLFVELLHLLACRIFPTRSGTRRFDHPVEATARLLARRRASRTRVPSPIPPWPSLFFRFSFLQDPPLAFQTCLPFPCSPPTGIAPITVDYFPVDVINGTPAPIDLRTDWELKFPITFRTRRTSCKYFMFARAVPSLALKLPSSFFAETFFGVFPDLAFRPSFFCAFWGY